MQPWVGVRGLEDGVGDEPAHRVVPRRVVARVDREDRAEGDVREVAGHRRHRGDDRGQGRDAVATCLGGERCRAVDVEHVTDLDPLGLPPETRVRDVTSRRPLPDLLTSDGRLAAEFGAAETQRRADVATMLRRTDVSAARVGHTDDVVPMIVRMLEKRRRGR